MCKWDIGACDERDISSIFCMFVHPHVDLLIAFFIHKFIWSTYGSSMRTIERTWDIENWRASSLWFAAMLDIFQDEKRKTPHERQQITLYIKSDTHTHWRIKEYMLNEGNPYEKYQQHLSHSHCVFHFRNHFR